mmetsp:Transcript_101363/g.282124  ORF Transcript_101363/g.282124 Transcript_101363/m.282124 type:complete len:226 (-) Transcript_101363:872-1549(-)
MLISLSLPLSQVAGVSEPVPGSSADAARHGGVGATASSSEVCEAPLRSWPSTLLERALPLVLRPAAATLRLPRLRSSFGARREALAARGSSTLSPLPRRTDCERRLRWRAALRLPRRGLRRPPLALPTPPPLRAAPSLSASLRSLLPPSMRGFPAVAPQPAAAARPRLDCQIDARRPLECRLSCSLPARGKAFWSAEAPFRACEARSIFAIVAVALPFAVRPAAS